MEIHLEIWNNEILRLELPWVFIIVSSAEFTQQARVLKMELAASLQKPELIQRGVT